MKKLMALAISFLIINTLMSQGINKFYGNAYAGGSDNLGVLFTASGTGTSIQMQRQFTTTSPGVNPVAEPVLSGVTGKYYGTTPLGGASNAGLIYEWDDATSTYTKKFDFDGAANGGNPVGPLTEVSGILYGAAKTNSLGGGLVFSFDPSNSTYTVIYNFNSGTDVFEPVGGLLYDASTNRLLGLADLGGTLSSGGIYEIDLGNGNAYTTDFSFDPGNGYNTPTSMLVKSGVLFYGTTLFGGANGAGNIFKWDGTISNNPTTVYSFGTGVGDGSNPFGKLITSAGGNVYGLTVGGGSQGAGTIYEYNPSGTTYTKRVDFQGAGVDISAPYGSLQLDPGNGKYYGIGGGGANGYGAIIEWDPAGSSVTVVNSFTKPNGTIDLGSGFTGSLGLFDGTKFIGVTPYGGSSDQGVVFSFNPGITAYAKLVDLNASIAANPLGGLVYQAGNFYGMTSAGGDNGVGVIYQWDPVSNTFTKQYSFDNINGALPQGSLVYNSTTGKFYGMTSQGGAFNYGVIFEWDPINGFIKDVDFDNTTNGGTPVGSLVFDGTNYYGLNSVGGTPNLGVIFQWAPGAGAVSVVHTFGTVLSEGNSPLGSLVQLGTKLYGTTTAGGVNGEGTIFSWDLSGSTYADLISFNSGTSGSQSKSTLTVYGGNLYGTTTAGGAHGTGCIFKYIPGGGSFPTVYSFPATATPNGELVLNGTTLYGTSGSGGGAGAGYLFGWDPATGSITATTDFNGTNGSSPASNNDLYALPAPTADGTGGTCSVFPTVNISAASGNLNTWVPITDAQGNAVAEIKANGNDLGTVTASAYINNTSIRKDFNNKYYLDRNITITPTTQPTGPDSVEVRFYLKGSEYDALKTASAGGITTISDVRIFKNSDNCPAALQTKADSITMANANAVWNGTDYVVQGSVHSFSTFYFSSSSYSFLALTFLEFNGRLQNNDALLSWKTANETNTSLFEIQRSFDGSSFNTIGKLNTSNSPGSHSYSYTDFAAGKLAAKTLYYRLKEVDIDGGSVNSKTIAIGLNAGTAIQLYPNPVAEVANLTITVTKSQQVQGRIIDNTGRVVKQMTWNLNAGSTNSLSIDVSSLEKGTYFLQLNGATINDNKTFTKQ